MTPRWQPGEVIVQRHVMFGVVLVGWPLVLKATRGGYDGKGVWVVDDLAAAAELLASGTPLLAEQRVSIVRELAADVAR